MEFKKQTDSEGMTACHHYLAEAKINNVFGYVEMESGDSESGEKSNKLRRPHR